MVNIKELPPRLQGIAYMQFYTRMEALKTLRAYRARSYFKIVKDKKPTWIDDWQQTYTLVPIRKRRNH